MRKFMFGLILAAVTAAALAPAAVSAQGTPEDKRVFFTFSGPVAVPGVTLPAGKYLFRLPTSIASGERHVMQVLSSDGRNSYAMFFGISATRTDYPKKPEVRFMETAAGMPPAVKTWWYPGERSGYEFIYPKEQARLLREGTGQPAPIAEPEVVTPPAAETAYVPEPVTGEIAPPSLPVVEPPIEPRQELPKTASDVMLMALVGVGLILGGAVLKVVRTLA